MIAEGLVADGRNYTGNTPPRTVGSSASRLLRLVDGSHYGGEACSGRTADAAPVDR